MGAPTPLATGAVLLALAGVVAGAWGLARRRPGERTAPAAPALPSLALSPEAAAAVTRLELTRPDDAEPPRSSTIVLERRGATWNLTAPLHAPASADKVAALLANLQDLQVDKRLDAGSGFYDRYDLTQAKALHVVAQADGRTVVDFFAGQSSEQGQLVRLPGVPGLFALINRGPHRYQGFLYARDLRGWRDPTLLAFDEADVVVVEIVNPHGAFTFTRRGVAWTGAFARRRDGKVEAPRPTWPRFDPARLDELLHAYHALAADDFGDARDKASAGLDRAEQTGGVVHIRLRQNLRPLSLLVGGMAPGGSRFAIPGSRWAVTDDTGGSDDALYALSPWTARWATADERLFERSP
jgi:hypothetical protein